MNFLYTLLYTSVHTTLMKQRQSSPTCIAFHGIEKTYLRTELFRIRYREDTENLEDSGNVII